MVSVLAVSAAAQTRPERAPEQAARPSTARITEDVPGPRDISAANFIRMQPQHTPSGLAVPRYVSLKYNSSNGRTGPSRAHPVSWHYKRRGLPMIIVAETEMWRKVRDMNGDESWMDKRLLKGTRTVLARTDLALRSEPRSDAKVRASAAKGALLTLEGCDDSGWCKIKHENLSGYALQSLLWGAAPL